MFFKGSIYITDPCYIAKEKDWCDENGFDILNYAKDPTIDSSLGFTDYLMEDTGIGDGSWTVYEVDPKLNLSLDDIYEIIEDTDNDLSEFKEIGNFTAYAGMSCVVYKTEADKYNPEFKKTLPEKCCTTIEDFDGRIVSYFDEDSTLHFVGIGNIIFFTA